jgi:hypothetical protein
MGALVCPFLKTRSMIENFKLRHLDEFSKDEIDFALLMREVDGFEISSDKSKHESEFFESYQRISDLLVEVSDLDIMKVELSDDVSIKYPVDVYDITFLAMMQLQGLRGKGSGDSISDFISEYLSMFCFSENHKGIDFDSEGDLYKDFKAMVLELPLVEAMGLYNHLDSHLNKKDEFFNKLFFEVSVDEPDYVQAGGEKMRAFNVIESIKAMCADFNIPIDKAWQQPYALSQTNSLAKSTSAYIQSNMADIRERKMKQKRG